MQLTLGCQSGKNHLREGLPVGGGGGELTHQKSDGVYLQLFSRHITPGDYYSWNHSSRRTNQFSLPLDARRPERNFQFIKNEIN